MSKGILVVILVSISFSAVFGQEPGQMKVVRPSTPNACIESTTVWQGEQYYVLRNTFNPRKDNILCTDSPLLSGKYLAYYERSSGKGSVGLGQTEQFQLVGWTYEIQDGMLWGAERTYMPDGRLGSIVYYDSLGSARRYEAHGAGWLSQAIEYNSDGSYSKMIYYYQNGVVKREVFYKPTYLEDGTITHSVTGAMEYTTNGVLVYKYNCQSGSRVKLNPDGSVAGIENNASCDYFDQ